MKILLATLALALLAGTAKADSVWNYSGNVMTGCNCSLDGTFTLNAGPALSFNQESGTPVTWDFTDGTHTLTNANSTAIISVTQPAGWPLLWHIDVFNTSWELYSTFYGSAFEATDSSGAFGTLENGWLNSYGYLEGNRGTLTNSVSAPEPSTLALLGLGLLALIARGRKRAKVSSVWEPLA